MSVIRTLAMLLCLCPALVAAAASEGKLLDLPVAVTAAAVDPMTGNVALVSATDNQVWLLPSRWFDDSSVELTGPLVTASNPVAVLFKRYQDRSYLVAACFDDEGIIVLDATTREVVAKIPPTPMSPSILVSASDSPQDPWIYVTGMTGNRVRLDAFRIDSPKPKLVEIETRNQVSLLFKPAAGAFYASSNGQSLYGLDEARRTITRWSLHAPTASAEPPTTKYVANSIAIDSKEPLIRLPIEQGIAQGTAHRLANLRLSPHQYPFRAACAVGNRPLLIGLSGRNLQVASLTTGKVVAQTPLPNELRLESDRSVSLSYEGQTYRQVIRPIALADEVRDRILVIADRQAYAMRMTPLNLPDDPILASGIVPPTSWTVNEELAIEVKSSDPRVEVELSAAPSGMRLTDNHLTWSPTFTQLGPMKFSLRLRHGEATAEEDCVVEVVSHTALCQFPATRACIDETGTRLIVWTSHAPHRIGMIDLVTRDTIAVRTFPTSIITAALVGETLCVLSNSEKEGFLSLIDTKSFETTTQRTIEIESTVRYLENSAIAMTDKTVAISTPSGIVHRYARSDLQELSDEGANKLNANSTPLLTNLRGFVRHIPQPASPEQSPWRPSQHALVTFTVRDLKSPPDYKQRFAPIVCEAFSVRLGMQLISDSTPGYTRIDLVARTLHRDDVIHRWPVDLIETAKQTRDVEISLSVNGTKAVLVIGARVFVKDLKVLSGLELPQPFRLQPIEIPFVAKLDSKTRLHYSLVGGEAPHALDVMLPVAAGTSRQSAWATRALEANGQFDADIAGYVKDQLAQVAESLTSWSPETAAAESIMTAYVGSVAEAFASITGQKPAGVPVAILLVVNARDAQGQTLQLRHYLLADIPRATLEREMNLAVAKRWPGTTVAKEASAYIAMIGGSQKSSEIIRFSQGFRRGASPDKLSAEQLEVAAQSALARFELGWQKMLDKQRATVNQLPLRQWGDASGKTVNARFEQYFAEQVIVTPDRGSAVTFNFASLSEADQAYVREVTAPRDPVQQAARRSLFERSEKLRHIAIAVHNFHNVYKSFPPPAFVDDGGSPITSWRVMLLPFVGGQELYQLFRLDEPWDSEHNQRLAKYMPSIYRIAEADTAPNATPIVRLAGSQTASPSDQRIGFRDVIDGNTNTLLATIVNAENAVVWTQPGDLNIEQQGEFREQLWWHEGHATVVMCDGSVKLVKQTTSAEAWHHAAIRNDGHPPSLETD